jgi:hypothetical protein
METIIITTVGKLQMAGRERSFPAGYFILKIEHIVYLHVNGFMQARSGSGGACSSGTIVGSPSSGGTGITDSRTQGTVCSGTLPPAHITGAGQNRLFGIKLNHGYFRVEFQFSRTHGNLLLCNSYLNYRFNAL